MKKTISFAILLLLTGACVFAQQFKISYSPAAFSKPFTGKVYVYLNKNNKTPKEAMAGIEPFPCFSVDAFNIKPGGMVTIDDKSTSYPVKLSDIERGEYYLQAVWDRNLGGRAIAESPGNIYSIPVKVLLTKDYTKKFNVYCDQLIPDPGFKDAEFVKELKVPSALLSAFHKKPFTVDAAVILPKEYYTEPSRTFPVLFEVSGYGGDYHKYSGDSASRSKPIDSMPCIKVYLDGNCQLGHSVYANSDNNGPWGDALVKEFIPLLETKYRCNGGRILWGHSSGGWTVLWLQTQYPSVFAGCWSSSPDPVDFRDFQKIDLYAGDNMFYNKDSSLRSVATVAGYFPWATTRQAYQMEKVIDRGEQMHSFNAVFSAKGADGRPEAICNAMTGEVNKKAFEHWKKYDITHNVSSNWEQLKPLLDGKIRVSVGDQDNFLLNSAVHSMEAEMKKINANVQFEYFPGDHFTVYTKEYATKGYAFLAARLREWNVLHQKGF
jgi:S-formylglutathione hydrolase FrmB